MTKISALFTTFVTIAITFVATAASAQETTSAKDAYCTANPFVPVCRARTEALARVDDHGDYRHQASSTATDVDDPKVVIAERKVCADNGQCTSYELVESDAPTPATEPAYKPARTETVAVTPGGVKVQVTFVAKARAPKVRQQVTVAVAPSKQEKRASVASLRK